ncbi:Uncharacterized protein OBRU01_14356 [Operophtera brumata]|uniref:Uncharacterized protein n=1 Tax=Operophtera brumata TaxID=104452 RepID=A0A0L7L6Y4_OPEBR|nr:Uncharacterized protein OBRU01_14356 [Operophtera brumata]
MSKNAAWLDSDIKWPNFLKENVQPAEETIEESEEQIPNTTSDAGTCTHPSPRKSFEDLSNRQKRRRTEEIRASCSNDELVFVAESSLRATGKNDAANLVKYIMETQMKCQI